MAKDLFSEGAQNYARYRPGYPAELFDYILSFVKEKKQGWDCATGNGQSAGQLAHYFEKVEATDISEAQLANAVHKSNIHYQVLPAEKTSFADNSFDLITVATAYHWLDHEAFAREARRVGKNGCIVAVWVYHTLHSQDEAVNEVYDHFYHDITGPYWEAERRFVDEQYKTVAFDFSPLPSRPFKMTMHWTREDFLGYLSTWSAVRKYIAVNGSSPLALIEPALKDIWKDGEVKDIDFLLSLRLGKIEK